MEKQINMDYIGVVKEYNGGYKFEQIPIVKSLEIKEQLKAMCKNPNRTLLDMQEAFAMQFKTDKQGYGCCLPYSYDDSYINYVFYPQIKSYEKYHADKQAQIDAIKSDINKGILCGSVSTLQTQYEQHLKDEFLHDALRYIETKDFITTCKQIKAMDTVKMSSHEAIGWATMVHQINKDLTIKVLTNFGYGTSSYFFVNVCYKGIDLLPYAQTVNYYYANMQDIIAHTRTYRADRNSWHIALDFVANLSDRTQAGLEKLAYEWFRNEITEMIAGLKNIKQDSKKMLDRVAENRLRNLGNLISVRSMSDQEVAKYKVYPEELALLFKVEKISNALSLLKKLEQAAEIYPDSIQAIQTIKELNQSIVPEIIESVEVINHQIGSLQEKLKPIDVALANADAQKKELDEHANAVYARLQKQNPELKWDTFKTMYNKKHPELTAVENTIKQLTEKRQKLKTEISDRQSFLARLQRCYNDIVRADLLAA